MTDQETVLLALDEAGKIISQYLEPGPRDAVKSIDRLIAILDNQEFARAIKRMSGGLKVVK
jgi:hypothetical protein